MNERTKAVIRILLLVAKWIAPSDDLKKDVTDLANHIAYQLKEPDKA